MHSFIVKGVRVSPLRSAIPVVLGALLLASAPASAVPMYSVTDLGPVYPHGINESGQITGSPGFVYDSGVRKDIPGSSNSYGINDIGQVVGSASNNTRAFLYDIASDTMTDIGSLGGTFSQARAVNNFGQVVGYSWLTTPGIHAFLYDAHSGTLTDLATAIGSQQSEAYDINDAGQVVGRFLPDGASGLHAFLYDIDTGKTTDLGTLGGPSSMAFGINDAGQVVGSAFVTDALQRAFVYDIASGTMTELGALSSTDSVALDINNAGQIVGWSRASGPFGMRAFLYDSGTMYDLNDLIDPDDPLAGSIQLFEATAINERGDIVASGCYVQECHGFLLTALATDPVRVPEPGSLALLGGALLGVPLVRRLRPTRH